MGETPDGRELEKRIEIMAEQMNTLRSDLDATLSKMRADMADWKTAMVGRDKDNHRSLVNTISVATAVLAIVVASGFAFIGLMG